MVSNLRIIAKTVVNCLTREKLDRIGAVTARPRLIDVRPACASIIWTSHFIAFMYVIMCFAALRYMLTVIKCAGLEGLLGQGRLRWPWCHF